MKLIPPLAILNAYFVLRKTFVKEFTPLAASARLKRADRAARSKDGDGGTVQNDIPTGPAFEPTCVYRMLSVIQTDTMVEGRQEDAEEFLSCLLNGLNDEMLDLMKLTELSNGDVSDATPVIPHPSNGELESLSPEEADEWKVTTKLLICVCTHLNRIFNKPILLGHGTQE